ncbi:MAG: peptidoglycan-binding protein [Cyanobacteria bacterium CRU_2_1]|nr:peptidoglycan-binding protein [Cyanobacteria bacterium RU_5_0]NJR62972.1 peptidoglycan-binding protein [Cyanobacteria bacterium CRU_2_1]
METFVYLQLAQENEDPASREIIFLQHNYFLQYTRTLFASVWQLRLSSQAIVALLSLLCSTWTTGMSSALAQSSAPTFVFDDSSSSRVRPVTVDYPPGYADTPPGVIRPAVADYQTDDRYITPEGIDGFRLIGCDRRPAAESECIVSNAFGDQVTVPYCSLYPGTSGCTSTIPIRPDYPGCYVPVQPDPCYQPIRPIDPDFGFVPVRPGGEVFLRRGDTGAEVVYIQDLLREAGYFNATSTGFYATLTEAGVKAFQRDAGLGIDGIVGAETLAALEGFRPIEPDGKVVLRPGDRGSRVAGLQRALAQQGYYFDRINGYYGASTQNAVFDYQKDRGLRPTGIADSLTLDSLGLAGDGA